MQIESVRVRKVRMPRTDPAWRTASYAASELDGCTIEIGCDGKVGIGAATAHPNGGISADDQISQINGPVRNLLVGADALTRTRIIEDLRAAQVHRSVLTAVDIALHDLLGKLAGMPCYALWGGAVRSGGAVARFVGIKDGDALLTTVEGLVEQGFTHLKVKLGTGLDDDVERIRLIRSAYGDRVWIGVDGNGAYETEDAIALCKALEQYDVRLMEQPIDYRDLDGLIRLTAESPIPVMADQFVKSLDDAMVVCQRRAAHVVSVKVGQAGSIDEARNLAKLCLSFGVRVHLGGGAHPAIVDAAAIHLAVSIPGIDEESEVGEFMALTGDPTSGVIIRDGRYEVSSAPGFGIALADA